MIGSFRSKCKGGRFPMAVRKHFTIREVASRTRLRVGEVRDAVAAGVIPSATVAGHLVIPRRKFERWWSDRLTAASKALADMGTRNAANG
jgi:hypothetical protein